MRILIGLIGLGGVQSAIEKIIRCGDPQSNREQPQEKKKMHDWQLTG